MDIDVKDERAIRKALLFYFPGMKFIKIISSDTGIAETSINWFQPAEPLWFDVLAEARRTGLTRKLIKNCVAEFPELVQRLPPAYQGISPGNTVGKSWQPPSQSFADAQMAELADQLRQAMDSRNKLLAEGHPTTEIDTEIMAVKRKMRQGPWLPVFAFFRASMWLERYSASDFSPAARRPQHASTHAPGTRAHWAGLSRGITA